MSSQPPHVSSPLAATAVLVDLRNFTPNLKASPVTADGLNVFCGLLSRFYGVCVKAATIAVGPDAASSVYVNSTGDGVLMVFFDDERHSQHGYLTTLLLNCALESVCASYNDEHGQPHVPSTSYGIGMESGHVCRVTDSSQTEDMVVETYIGDCINVAARVEGLTKTVHETHTIIGTRSNAALCRTLFDEDYDRLIDAALVPGLDDAERLAIYDQMMDLNRRLCLEFMHVAVLKGVDNPSPLFRIEDRRAQEDNPQFEELLRALTVSSEQRDAAVSFLRRCD